MHPHQHKQSGLPAQAELQAHAQWVCWRYEERKGKRTKVPYNPHTSQPARSNDPATWATYQQVSAVCQQDRERYQGIGFVFHQDYTGLDLDHCVRPDGSLDRWAQHILDRLASYAEYSPNDGVHVFLRGTVPAGLRRPLSFAPHAEAALEMYCQGRYFTITGRHVPGTPVVIQEVTGEVQAVVADMSLLEQAATARNGEKFRALWQGDTAGYLSASEADQALCNLLAFWTQHDATRVDRLFRLSGLYRPEKWDRAARAGETYGQGTITRACQQQASASKGSTENARRSGIILPFPGVQATPETQNGQRVGNLKGLHDLPDTSLSFILDSLNSEEAGDGLLYAHLFKGRCVYDHTEGVWYEWQGHFWKRDESKHALLLASGPLAALYLEASATLSEQAAQEARVLALNLQDEESAHAKEQYTRLKATTAALIERARRLKRLKRAQNVLTFAQAHLPIKSEAWDKNPWLLGTPDGVLDLHTGTLRPGQPDDYIRTIIPTSWQGLQTPAPRFTQFLQEIFSDRPSEEREELLAFLQRALGYGITGNVDEHMFLMLYGEEGRNGKDTLMSVLHHVLGPLVGAVSNDVIIASSKFVSPGSAKPHLCSLQGKRMVWASETDKGARFDVGQVKYLTGGGSISARQLYGKDYTFTPSHLLILLTNHKPHADAADAAFWDRLCPIIFNLRFIDHPTHANERRRDTSLGHALKAEASGILAWLVQGCLAWQQQGLAIPHTVHQDRQAYRQEEDTLGDFLQECCIVHEQAHVRASALYAHYKEWTTANNLRALNGKLFGLEMKKRVASQRDRLGMYYQGISLLASEDANDEKTEFVQTASDIQLNSSCVGCEKSTKSSETSPQADSGSLASSSCVGCVGTFHNLPLRNTPKCTLESFQESPTHPTPDELTKTPLNEPEKPVEIISMQASAPISHPTQDEVRKDTKSSTEEQAYEEFDL